MKILHTADWHLGRTLAGRDLLDDQRQTLDHLIEIARANSVDAIVIAGDVYDRAQPAEDAVILFGDVLEKLRKIAPVICIAGNHDSAGRISYLSGLLTERGVYMAGVEFGAPKSIDIECANGNIRFHLMPYATPEEVRSALEVDGIRTHDDATCMRLALAEIAADIPNVLVAHLFAQGCHPSDSERDISVGGIATIDTSVFGKFAYTALGHLHEPHNVPSTSGVNAVARYSGSICRYSFSEEKHKKGVTLVTIDAESHVTTEHIDLPQAIGMRTIRGEFAHIEASANLETPETREAALVRVELTDVTLIHDAHSKLRRLYPNLVEMAYVTSTSRAGAGSVSEARVRDGKPIELFHDFLNDRGAHLSDIDKVAVIALAGECMALADGRDAAQ